MSGENLATGPFNISVNYNFLAYKGSDKAEITFV
jgi:hypothetical protein